MRKTTIEDFEKRGFEPLMLRSGTLLGAIVRLDRDIWELEEENDLLREKVKEWRDKYNTEINKQLSSMNRNIADTLMACIATPRVESIGTVGATLIARIRDMQTIEEVKEFISAIGKDMKEETNI